MSRLSDEELSRFLHQCRGDARCVPYQPFANAQPNDCHENVRKYAEEYPGCILIRGWLIEEFLGGNFFIAHTVVQRPDGAWIDPTPMNGRYPFLQHVGSDDDFEEQRRDRPQVQCTREITIEELNALFSEFTSSISEQSDLVDDESYLYGQAAEEDV